MLLDPVDFLARYIEKETGIVFDGINLYQLKTRLEEIVKFENLSSIEELSTKFTGLCLNPGLKQRLLDHSTNNETLFFRDPTFFSALENFVMRELLLDGPTEIKIWSAASSTGQEALSIAMAMDELSSKLSLPPISILATDISEKAIKKAKAGIYSDFEMMRGLSEQRRDKYFTKVAEGWQVRPSLQSKISYRYNNLIHSTVSETFHIILCRNVLIYQKVEMKKKVVESLYRQLDPTGAILLGVGETLLGIRDNPETVMIGNVIFYKNSKNPNSNIA